MTPSLSVVVPVCNESPNIGPLVEEICGALAGVDFEIIYVDDGSSDDSAEEVLRARQSHPQCALRLLRHSRRAGQSAALATGVAAARAQWVATLDGDGQNDPADLPALLAARGEPQHAGVRLIMGNRARRRDSAFRRLQSRLANKVRAALLDDGTPDTGCGIKLFERETFLRLPYFDHMHRFLPALFQRQGAAVVSVVVNHRPRQRGQSKYGMFNRLWVGIVDTLGVMWLQRRRVAGLRITEEQDKS